MRLLLLFLLLSIASTRPAMGQASWEKGVDGFRKVLQDEGHTIIWDHLERLSQVGDLNKISFSSKDGVEGYIIVVAYTYASGHNPAMSGYLQFLGDKYRVNLTVKGKNEFSPGEEDNFRYLYAKVKAKPEYPLADIIINSPIRDYAIPCWVLVATY